MTVLFVGVVYLFIYCWHVTADPKRALCWRTRDECGAAVPIERGGRPHMWERGRDLTLCSDATAYEVAASVGAAFAVIFRSFGGARTAASGGPAGPARTSLPA